MANPNATLIGWPVYSDVGVLYTPDFDASGDWESTLPLTNLQSPELWEVARSKTAALADTRWRMDLKTDRAVRVLGVVYRSPERTGAPTTAARFRFLGMASTAQGVLFVYEAGDDVAALGGSSSRTGTATYNDAGGVVRTAATGVLRDGHFIGGERHTLYEASSVNLALQSENFGTTWVADGTPTRSAGAHTASGISLDLIGDDAAGSIEGYHQTVTFTGNAVKAISVYVKEGTSPAAHGPRIFLNDATAATNRLLADVVFVAGVPSVTVTTGTYLGYETLAGGVFRLIFVTTSVTAANVNTLFVQPAGSTGEQGNAYVGGVQAEDAPAPTSYIKTTTATVTRNADSLSFPTISSNGTIYQKYWDIATLAYVETTGAYTSGAAIPFSGGRAYVSTRIATGTKTQGEMQALVYSSGWFAPFPAGKTAEDTEGQNLAAWRILTAATMRYVSVQIDDSLNAAGYVDLNRFVVTGGIQPPTNTVVGAKLGLETNTQNSDGDLGVTSSVRRPVRRNVTCGYDEQSDADALGFQFPMQRIAGTTRQMAFVWDPTDTTYLQDRTFLATLAKLSDFEANIGNRWVIPYVFREVL